MNLYEQIDRMKTIMGIINEGEEHIKNLYKSWANKKSGNPEAAMKIMDDVIANRRSLPKKDFANYTSYEELLNDLNKINQPKPSEDITEFYRGDIKKGDDLVVIAANTWEASCNYGASSKWCTTAKDTDSYWRRHNQTGTEFFWIFRNKPESDPNHKLSYHISINGSTDWCNAVNNCRTSLPDDSYPKQHPKYDEIIAKLKEFHDARGLEQKRKESMSVSQINDEFIHSWLQEHSEEVLTELKDVINLDIFMTYRYEGEVYHFMESDGYEIMPLNVSVDEWEDDEDMKDKFRNDLYNHLENQHFDYDVLFTENFINSPSLTWIVDEVLINDFNFDPTGSFEEQMSENNISVESIINSVIFKDGIEEVITEVFTGLMYDHIYYYASDFASSWEP